MAKFLIDTIKSPVKCMRFRRSGVLTTVLCLLGRNTVMDVVIPLVTYMHALETFGSCCFPIHHSFIIGGLKIPHISTFTDIAML